LANFDTDSYRLVEKIALGAESVLYKARSAEDEFCVKTVRNWLGKLMAPSRLRQHSEKLTVSYSSKLKHIRNEFEIGQKLQQIGEIPVVRIYALRRVRSCIVQLGYDLLMEYIDGEDLGDRKTVNALSLADKIDYFYQSTMALRYVHQTGIAHLDMKPSNIMIRQGTIKLIDFGMSTTIGGHLRSLSGTAGYLSPEQIVQERIDEATDIFGLGVTFAVIFGSKPLRQNHDDLQEKNTRMEARFHLANTSIPLIDSVPEARDIPELEKLIQRCTVPKREHRLGDTKHIIATLQRIANDQDIKLTQPRYSVLL